MCEDVFEEVENVWGFLVFGAERIDEFTEMVCVSHSGKFVFDFCEMIYGAGFCEYGETWAFV